MTYEEKSTWIYGAIALGVPAVYFAIMLGQLGQTPTDQIEYVGALLTAIGVSIGISIVANILLGIVSPKRARRIDERDKRIAQRGFNFGFFVFSIAMVAPFVLALAEAPHFWIANTIYLAFSFTALAYSALKVVAYRRGI